MMMKRELFDPGSAFVVAVPLITALTSLVAKYWVNIDLCVVKAFLMVAWTPVLMAVNTLSMAAR